MGFKQTSELIAISFGLSESAANTFTQEEVALQLDILNQEIFVVLAVDLNPTAPEMVAGTGTEVRCSLTATTQTAIQNLSNTNTIAEASQAIVNDGLMAVPFVRTAEESISGNIDYISIIATNNFFVAVAGVGNTAAKGVTGRLWGYRARADAAQYAALVQSEVLSA